MIFKLAIVFAVLALTAAAAVSDDVHAEITHQTADVRADGFDSELHTSNNIDQEQHGDEHGNIHGEFGWVDPSGEHVKVTYVADENGYQPQSEWLPTPPPIPEAIARSLEYLRSHPPHEEKTHH